MLHKNEELSKISDKAWVRRKERARVRFIIKLFLNVLLQKQI